MTDHVTYTIAVKWHQDGCLQLHLSPKAVEPTADHPAYIVVGLADEDAIALIEEISAALALRGEVK